MRWLTLRSARFFALAGLFAAAALPASAQTLYRSVSVDASTIAARDNPVLANNIRTLLQADLNRSFADRLTNARNAPQLVVRITGIQTAALPDGPGGKYSGSGSTAANDYLKGEALVVSGGRVIKSYPMLSALSADYAGGWNQQDGDAKRLAALTWHYASWLRREIGDR